MDKVEDILKYIQLYTSCSDHTLKRIRVLLDDLVIIQEVPIYKEKIVYVHKKRISVPILHWANEWLTENELTYAELSKKSRSKNVVSIRNKFCNDAFIAGYGYSEIGRYLKKDHTTIIHCIHKIKRVNK